MLYVGVKYDGGLWSVLLVKFKCGMIMKQQKKVI